MKPILNEGVFLEKALEKNILIFNSSEILKAKETTKMESTKLIQKKLEELLKTVILSSQFFKADYYWSGIMGIRNQKKPILKTVSKNIHCGIRSGGISVATGSSIGKQLACLYD